MFGFLVVFWLSLFIVITRAQERNPLTDFDPMEIEMDYLTVKEYAKRFRVHEDTVYAAIRMNLLRFEVIRVAARGAIRIKVPRDTVKHLQSQQ